MSGYHNPFRPKIRVWDRATHTSVIHVFLGEAYAAVAPVLKLLGKGEGPSAEHKEVLQHALGADFEQVLAWKYRDEHTTLQYHKHVFYRDDTVNMFRKKVCYYVGLPSPNAMYFWYRQAISKQDPLIVHTFIHHMFRKDGRIPFSTFCDRVQEYFQIRLDREMYHMIEKTDAFRLLMAKAPKDVAESLCFKYLYDKYIEYMSFDPFHQSNRAMDAFSVQNTLSLLMQNFEALDDMYHVVLRQSEDPSTTYFPWGDSNPLTSEDIAFLEAMQTMEKEVMSTEVPPSFTADDIVNYVHIRGNEAGISRRVSLESLFQQWSATKQMPFLRFKSRTHVVYKVHKESLPHIHQDMLQQWTTLSSTRDDRASITCKLGYHGRGFCTFHVMDDLSYHIKFNFSVKDKERLADVDAFLVHLRQLVRQVQSCYPHHYVPNLPKDVLYASSETDIVRVSQIIMTSHVSSPADIKYSQFQHVLQNQLYPYFHIIDSKDPSVLHLQYKKVNHFTRMNNLDAFLFQRLNLEPTELVRQVMYTFMISKEEAEKEIETFKIKHSAEMKEQGTQFFWKMKSDTFVNVKVRMNHPLALKFLVNGLTDMHMFAKIQHLMKVLLVLASKRKKAMKEEVLRLVEAMDAKEKQSLEENEVKIIDLEPDFLGMEGVEEDFGEEGFELDEDLLALGAKFEDAEPEEGGPVETTPAPPAQATQGNADSEEEGTSRRYILSKLHEADRELFDYKLDKMADGKRRREYSSLCGWAPRRQPVVIEKHELDKIQKEHPDALHGYVKTGSTPALEKKNYYICPAIWCPKSRVALSFEEYVAKDRTCPMEDEKPIEYTSANFWGEGDKGLARPHYPGFHDKFTHPKQFCLPCCFKKEAKEGNRNKQRKDMCITNQADEGKEAPLPTGEGDDVIGNEKYIKGEHYTPLEQNRFGMMPQELVDYFGFTHHGARHDGTGLMTDETHAMFRKGIRQGDQSFLECMVYVLDNPNIKHVSDLLQVVDHHLDMLDFMALENGRVLKMFLDPSKNVYDPEDFNAFRDWFRTQRRYLQQMSLELLVPELDKVRRYSEEMPFHQEILREFMMYHAWVNFKTYLQTTSVVKRHELVLDLLVNHLQTHINQQRLNVFVMEVSPDSGKVLLDCHVNKDTSMMDRNKPFVFLLKRGSYYEPLCLVTNKKNQLDVTWKFVRARSPPEIRKLIDFYMLNCSDRVTTHNHERLLLQLQTKGYKVKYIVVDYGFKACGAIFQGNVYVPFIEREHIFFVKNVRYIYLHEVPNYQCTQAEADILTLYGLLQKLTQNDFYRIHHAYVVGNKLQGLFVDQGNVFVPLRLRAQDRHRMMFQHGLFLLLGQEQADERNRLLQSLYRDHDMLHKIQALLEDYLQAHPEAKKELEFLRDPDNPLPETFKRQKLLEWMRPVLQDVPWNMNHANRTLDLLLQHSHSLSTYVQQRLRRYRTSDAEVLLDHADVVRGKLLSLKLEQENPYQYLLGKVDQMTAQYVFEDQVEAAPLPPIFHEGTQRKDVPVKFRKLLKGFQLISMEEGYHKNYMLHVFLTVAHMISSQKAFTHDLYQAALQHEVIEKYTHGKVEEVVENPWVLEYLRKRYGKLYQFPVAHVLEAIEQENYYPSILDVKLLARLAKVNVVISGRKTLRNPDGLEVVDHGSHYYVLLQFSYDRFHVLDRFELYCKEQQILFDVMELPEEFRTILEKKKHIFEVDVVE